MYTANGQAADRPRGVGVHVLLAMLAGLLAVVSLLGWTAGLPRLTSFVANRPSLAPMTALVLLLAAAAAASLPARTRLAAVLGALEAVCGAAIVAAHLLGWPAGLDLPPAWWSSRLTGTAFAMSGAALVLLASGRFTAGQVLAFGVLMYAVLLGLGHSIPMADLYGYMPGTGVAIPTVLAFIALSLSQLLACRDQGIAGAMTARSMAGRTGLRLLLGGLCSVLLLATLALLARRHGLFDAETAVLLVAWAAMAVLGATLWALAIAVDRADLARSAAERDRNQLRQLVAAAVTHDLRSPLQAATLSTLVLQRLVADPRAAGALERVHRSHRRLDRLLRSLLDSLALGAGGRLALHASRVELHDLLREVVAENDGALASRVSCEGEATGWWDRDALFRVLENLLLNAVKYGAPGAPIACRINVLPADEVRLTVDNQGPPIPAAEWETIFEPFTRGGQAQATGSPGWGVGLAYARSVATSHGGTMRVTASGPQGTRFELRIPLDGRLRLARAAATAG